MKYALEFQGLGEEDSIASQKQSFFMFRSLDCLSNIKSKYAR